MKSLVRQQRHHHQQQLTQYNQIMAALVKHINQLNAKDEVKGKTAASNFVTKGAKELKETSVCPLQRIETVPTTPSVPGDADAPTV
ncbi:hypothetical protein CYMTET_56448 [Cymbomonas tetramitiformis]|uniref:Uncharacterized protein n=1 Tax=Cymbomonas tetramitiformis TaxID=36881 RepID=A0AAE0EMJ5_9CHLO|nr:hypothetical protein CYMTET_56448 [Cymbomonas tetramitiformis]